MISSITTRKKPGCCILDKLEMGEREEGVAVVQSRKDECLGMFFQVGV